MDKWWIFVLNPSVIELIEDDKTIWEEETLPNLANNKQLYAYKHHGFWQPMDILREKIILNKMWNEGSALWKIW